MKGISGISGADRSGDWRLIAKRAGLCLAVSLAIGVSCGLGAVFLSWVCDGASSTFQHFPTLVFALPLLAVATITLYLGARVSLRYGTIDVIRAQRDAGPVPPELAPCITIGTACTLLGGGSVGKEAAALQMGASLASFICREAKLFQDRRDVVIAAGMASAFSALLFAPIAATLFVIELSRKRRERLLDWHALVIPFSAIVSWAIASLLGVGRLWDPWACCFYAPSLESLPDALAIGAACAIVGIAFVVVLKSLRSACERFLPSPYASTIVASMLMAGFVIAFGTRFCGTGGQLIDLAIAGEQIPAHYFAVKLLLTALCLACGLKGGEVMPVLCSGACLGSALAPVLGADQALMASVGMVSFFAACTGCPWAAIALSVEAFGVSGLPWMALSVAAAHFLSLRVGLYETDSWSLAAIPAYVKHHLARDLGRGKGRKHD